MINKKEGFTIGLVILIIGLSISISMNVLDQWTSIFTTLLAVSIIILLNVFTKKIVAYSLDAEVEMKVWEIKLPKVGMFRKLKSETFPMGAILPLITKIILFPLKSFIWMASLVFDVKPKISRSSKRYGLYTFSDMTEYHLGIIAASGILINLIAAFISYFLGFPFFSKLNIYYAFFNIIPLSDLDGNKIFFGSLVMWAFLASLVLIGMAFSLFII